MQHGRMFFENCHYRAVGNSGRTWIINSRGSDKKLKSTKTEKTQKEEDMRAIQQLKIAESPGGLPWPRFPGHLQPRYLERPQRRYWDSKNPRQWRIVGLAKCFLVRGAVALETEEELPEGTLVSWDRERNARNGGGKSLTLFVRTNIRATSVTSKAGRSFLWVKLADLQEAL